MKNLILVCLVMIGLIGCGLTQDSIVIPADKYKANYDKMFEAAITAGVKQGFKPTYQDKKQGLITLERFVNRDDTFTINITFGNVAGGQGFEMTARSSDMNPTIGLLVNPIKEAILQAAGMPLK